MGCTERKKHHFHNLEHFAPDRHHDQICCWCGYRVCNVLGTFWEGPKDHGPYQPIPGRSDTPIRYLLARKPDSEGLQNNKKLTQKMSNGKVRVWNKSMMILRRIADGHTTEQISKDLGLSMNTINTHRRELKDAFQANNLFEVVAKAIRQGYI